jgi:hypothetical protein
MNILVLTKMKEYFLKSDVQNVNDYLKYDYFFEGFVNGFKKLGHNVHLMWDESYFLPPFFKLKFLFGYKVCYFLFKKTGFRNVDRYLLSKKIATYCKENKIDFIFTEINNFISPATIKKINPAILVTQWYGIFPEMSNKDTLKILSEYDVIFGPCEFHKDKVFFDGIDRLIYIGCGVNNRQFFHDFDTKFQYDIVFVGGVGKGHNSRIEILEFLAQNYDSFAFYGYGIENIPNNYKLKSRFKGWADVDTIRKLYSSSKIVLNLTLDGYERVKKGFNTRLFEISACNGGVQIVKNDAKIKDFFEPSVDLEVFEDIDDLKAKIDIMIKDSTKRKIMSDSAYKKSQLHTYDEKAKMICDFISERINK